MIQRELLILVGLALQLSVAGQSYIIRNAQIVPVSGPDISGGSVLIENGKITGVGLSVHAPRRATRIDGRGLTVYPGLFNSDTNLGLTEVERAEVTNDYREMGDYTPQLLAWSAVHVESEHIPVARVDGITHVVTRPSGGTISGQGAIIHLDGWNPEQMEIDRHASLYLSLPGLMSSGSPRSFSLGGRGSSNLETQERFDKTVAELKELFAQVRQYARHDSGERERNRQLEALIPAATGKQLVVLEANSQVDIREAVRFARGLDLNFAISGASDAWKVATFLKENNVRVILGPVQKLPRRADDPLNIVYATPGILHQIGVQFALSTGGSSDARTLAFEVGNAVAHGLPHDAALRSVTLAPAEIFGVEDQIGSIEPGKWANLVVTDGDIFEYQTRIRHVFIKGTPVSLESKHTRLYQKYLNKPRTSR